MSTAFDTLRLADRLESAGFSAGQARSTALALSEAPTADLAKKTDIAEVKAEISNLRAEVIDVRATLKTEIAGVRAEIGELRATLSTEIVKVRTGLTADIAEVRADIMILKWMGGFALALLVAIFVKIFVHG